MLEFLSTKVCDDAYSKIQYLVVDNTYVLSYTEKNHVWIKFRHWWLFEKVVTTTLPSLLINREYSIIIPWNLISNEQILQMTEYHIYFYLNNSCIFPHPFLFFCRIEYDALFLLMKYLLLLQDSLCRDALTIIILICWPSQRQGLSEGSFTIFRLVEWLLAFMHSYCTWVHSRNIVNWICWFFFLTLWNS